MLDKKADDCLTRFSSIVRARDNSDPPTMSTMGEPVIEMTALILRVETVRCEFDVSHYRVLTRCYRPQCNKRVAWTLA
jgi:hypothetical protein